MFQNEVKAGSSFLAGRASLLDELLAAGFADACDEGGGGSGGGDKARGSIDSVGFLDSLLAVTESSQGAKSSQGGGGG